MAELLFTGATIREIGPPTTIQGAKVGILLLCKPTPVISKSYRTNDVRNRGKFTASFTEKPSESLAMT